MKIEKYRGLVLIETEVKGLEYVLVVDGEIVGHVHHTLNSFQSAKDWIDEKLESSRDDSN